MAIKKELDDKQGIADSLNNLGLVYCSKGDLDQALEYHQRSLIIWEELGNRTNIAKSLNNLGNAYQLKDDLDQALECLQQSLAIKEEQGNRQDIALTVNNLGEIYRGKGDLDQALEYYQRSLAISEELGIKQDIAMSLGNIGELYRKKGNSDLALEYYQQSLAIYEKIGNDPSTAVVLYELVWVTLDSNDPSLAQQYLQKLQQINERTDNRIIDQRYRVAKALSLKTSKRARHKVKAEEILEQVVDEEVADHSLTVTAMIHLCELLLFELKMTGEEEVLEEVKDLTHRLLDIAKQQSSHSLLAETYLFQSKFALMELDVERARKLLAQAHIIAEEKGLYMLARMVAQERDLLLSQLHKWERIIEQTPSRRKMIDLTQLDDLLERTIQKTVAVLTKEEKGISGEEVPKKKYELVYLDLLKDSPKIEKNKFRVAIAQIGLSQTGDILSEFYEEESVDLLRLRKDKVEIIESKVKEMIENAHSKEINVLLFPELIIGLNYDQLLEDVIKLAKIYNMYIIPGSSHDQEIKQNISVIIGPDGIL